MIADPFDWDEELPLETEEEVYRALLRALQRKQGFGLFFVQCTPAQGEKIITDLRRDLPKQQIQELHLEGEVTALYDQIHELWQKRPFDALVVDGLEASLYAYEDVKRLSGWSSEEVYNYSWKGVPKILSHLNQQREHLQNSFLARFMFLVPPFVVDYFIQRAPDFLDWRSGLFCFPRDPKEVAQDAERFIGGAYAEYLALLPKKRIEKILELKSLQHACEDLELRTTLLFELGLLFQSEQDYGNAIASYEKALEIKTDYDAAWNNRGSALYALGRYKEAIASYDKALEIKPDLHEAWNNRGNALSALGRKEEAIASYEKALEIKPDDHAAWNNRGYALSALGRKEEAIASYEKALEIKPDLHAAWYNKACYYSLQGQVKQAIETLQHVIMLNDKYQEMAKNDSDFDSIRQDERFRALIGE
ncbi:tetratricopeptide repeat protein [Leptolyngbya sp. PL-A3]|uniref:tetratricopeptide repeat protein n=1 Tax=Leptolyngbya sp. PL-A3 TaxID=2933911 RepID=UPI003299010A